MKILHHYIGRNSLYKIFNRVDKAMIIYTYTDGGSLVFHDKILPISKGVLCFISANTYHYALPDDVDKYDRSKIFMSEVTVQQILDLTPQNSNFYKLFKEKSVVYAKIPDNLIKEVERIFLDAKNYCNSSDFAGFICSFFRLMTYLEKYSVEQIPNPENFVSKTIEYINNNYSHNILLDDICKECHVSKHYLCRKFKAVVGMTVMEYILATRITAAKRLLSIEKMSIGEISEACGFSSLSYFCQAFKNTTGMTAFEYRNGLRH